MESKIHQLEKEAYRSVLAAFMAQSDPLTWDKEGLLTKLRQELRVSSDKHKELLARVNSDELLCRIRECRQRGRVGQIGPINRVQDSSSYKREKNVQQRSLFIPVPSGIHTQSVSTEQSPALGNCCWSKVHPRNGGENCRVQDPLIGRRLMTRLTEDNIFYEAVIRDYRSDEDLYGLVFDEGTPKETWEWVDLKEISPEYIRWICKDPLIDTSTLDHNMKESTNYKFEILHTESLLQEVEKVCSSSIPNPVLLHKASKKLKEHEQSLLTVINAIGKLVYTSDSESSNNNVHR